MGQVLAVLAMFIFCYWITAAFWVEMVIENKYTEGCVITPFSLYEYTDLNIAGSIIVFILISLTDPLYLFAKIVIGLFLLLRKLCRKLFLKKEEE